MHADDRFLIPLLMYLPVVLHISKPHWLHWAPCLIHWCSVSDIFYEWQKTASHTSSWSSSISPSLSYDRKWKDQIQKQTANWHLHRERNLMISLHLISWGYLPWRSQICSDFVDFFALTLVVDLLKRKIQLPQCFVKKGSISNSNWTDWSTIHNGNRTEWGPLRSVIIRVINKIGLPLRGRPIC